MCFVRYQPRLARQTRDCLPRMRCGVQACRNIVGETSGLRSLTRKPMRHDQQVCPRCGERIEKTASGVRRKYSCQNCGAIINKLLICERCGTETSVARHEGSSLQRLRRRLTLDNWRNIRISLIVRMGF
jgi:rRNA maturation endonuclease Nob1